MSEQFPNIEPPTPADIRSEAVMRAQGQLYDEMMMESEKGGLPLPVEDLQHRPYLDTIGRPRHANGKMAKTALSDKDKRLAYLDGAQSVGTAYEEMTVDQLREHLGEVEREQGIDALRSVSTEVDAVIQDKNEKEAILRAERDEQALAAQIEGYQSLGMLELAGELGEAEGSGNSKDARLIEDVLIDKWIKKAEKIGEYGDEPKEGSLTTEERENKLWDELMRRKEMQKEKYRVDKEFAAAKMHQLKDAGVSDDVVKSIPANYFFNEDDSDDEGKLFKTWLAAHPEVEDRLTDKETNGVSGVKDQEVKNAPPKENEIRQMAASILNSATHDAESQPTEPVPSENVEKKLSWREWFKDRLNREGAVTFKADRATGKKVGDATVHVERGGIDVDARTLLVAGVAGGLVVAAYAFASKGIPNPIEHLSWWGPDKASAADSVTALDMNSVPPEMDISNLPDIDPDNGAETAGSSTEMKEVTVKKNFGFTHTIADLFPHHEGPEYNKAHKAAIEKFGPDYMKGIETYTMPNGDLGIASPGKAIISSEVMDFLSKQLSK